ncbi:Peptide ABC transporter, permease protein MetI-like [Desulfonema limicola]|uniref:Peptide ABC transporter, permease protein MetI-like n=1 Tax=Desulfonema limicola TaxID=45656 RepID=A0A975BC61_9BACT|nr:ABC transporter permease [Desulfonema limicola]QTA82909.1 Peptide ABC transporter, permease protein MetI-like [Desulfonema limicola]
MIKEEFEKKFPNLIFEYMKSPGAAAALCFFLIIVLAALAAPLISIQNPYDLQQINIMDSRLAPMSYGEKGVFYLLGTDDQGRDIMSAIFYGLRISLFVGVASSFFALITGTFLGIVAAYLKGRTESLIMRTADLYFAFPSILIALILLAVMGRGIDKVIIALVLKEWAMFARIVHGTARAEREKEYIEAARCLALSEIHIIFRHLLPNCMPPLMVFFTVNMASAIMLEATLSFLGIGLPVTEPSLGLLIANGYEYMLGGLYWMSVFPGIALFLAVACVNLTADRLRDILNPRLQT